MLDTGLQWFEMLLRVLHVIIAAMWIGASFYIISWENKFNRTSGLNEGIEGNFWTIQGGDFYYIEKLKSAPPNIPEELHWFKYEAYFTWVSGFVLMCLVFYLNADAMLIDRTVLNISAFEGIAISLSSLAASWVGYNLYCRTRLAKNYPASAAIGLLFLVVLSFFYFKVFSQRAALLHVGAALGTIMSANVFFVIIPWHKRLISAIENGESLESLYSRQPGFRSRHNHYMTLPVLLIMLGGHFPLILVHPYNWILIPGLALAAGLFKHYHNLVQKQLGGLVYLLAGIVVILCLIYGSTRDYETGNYCGEYVSRGQVETLISRHCVSCHSAQPTDKTWQNAPAGVTFDQFDSMISMKQRIVARVVEKRDMPPGNRSNMGQAERQQLACWTSQDN